MWEAIRQNRSRSRWLIVGMATLLILLGWLIGTLVEPQYGGIAGVVAALLYWLLLLVIAITGGDKALVMGARARPVTKKDAPRLFNIVEEMTIASGLGKIPDVYIIDQDAPNAFAAGPRPDRAVIAVTSGLLKRLNRDELQGVIAHEIGHIKNLDIRFMTIAAVMVASITIIADLFMRSLWWGGASRRSTKADPRRHLALIVVAVAVSILAPICARLLYMACSRQREYLADASAARFTRYPEGLASALEKIALEAGSMKAVNRALAPLYIVNPLAVRGASGLMSTHPPTERRIRILRAMAGGAGYVDYEKAFKQVTGRGVLGESVLAHDERVTQRSPVAGDEARGELMGRIREVDGVLGRLAELLLIPCACGVQIRAPSNLKRPSVTCPRCGTVHASPKAEEAPRAADAKAAAPLRYRKRSEGWDSFLCACGKPIQISPGFAASRIRCPRCRRTIEVDGVRSNP